MTFYDVLRALVRGDRLPDQGEALAAIDAHEASEQPAAAAAAEVPEGIYTANTAQGVNQ